MTGIDIIRNYFPELNQTQIDQYRELARGLREWNEKINVISRKDMDQVELRHILHSLALAKFTSFTAGSKILDVGTGGGFPGLPLAVFFPDVSFTLVDSIAKKVRVVQELSKLLELKNVTSFQARAEKLDDSYDFIVSRAVTAFPRFYSWTKKLVDSREKNEIKNGILYLKGGDLSQEIGGFGKRISLTPVNTWFKEAFFEEKMILYLPL